MQELRVVAVSEDGASLALSRAANAHAEFALPLDERLRSAVRGTLSRLGQQAITLESALSPREIQARLRSGVTAEVVARAAGVPVDRIQRWAGPILAERAQVVRSAQAARVTGAVPEWPDLPLGEAVDTLLAAIGVAAASATWDSARRDDGMWLVELALPAADRPEPVRWLWDPTRRQVSPMDREAASFGQRPAPAPRTSGVSPLDDLLGVHTTRVVAHPADEPGMPTLTDLLEKSEPAAGGEGGAADESPAQSPSRRRSTRPALPSWTDIVAGSETTLPARPRVIHSSVRRP